MNRSCITQEGLVLLLVVSTSCPALYADFQPEQHVITTDANGASYVYAADLNGDGDLDVLSASREDDKIAWYANDGTGQFGPQQVITTAADGADCVYAADLDADGDLDVLAAFYYGEISKIAWYANDGTGRFGPQHLIATNSATACVYAADLDGDGDLDVLSAIWRQDEIAWYANDGTGQFGPQQVITTAADGASCVYAADLDVLSASYGRWTGSGYTDSKIAWYANDGTGQFGPQQVITTAAADARSVYAADLDGDGDLDVLSASAWDDKIAWYANDGTGQFGPQQVITTAADGADCVYASDLDGDGDLDVLSANSSSIAWYANDGSGHFGPKQIITRDADGTGSVYAADLDGDGDLDVLSASSSGYENEGKIAWYANDGSGHFGSPQVISTEDGQRCVYAADLDGDGDLDVLSTSAFHSQSPISPGEIAWYANDGSGHFGREQIIAARLYGAECVYAADLDGDGDLDVLSASSLDRKIAWYENE
jgi:hypothetical protein